MCNKYKPKNFMHTCIHALFTCITHTHKTKRVLQGPILKINKEFCTNVSHILSFQKFNSLFTVTVLDHYAHNQYKYSARLF